MTSQIGWIAILLASSALAAVVPDKVADVYTPVAFEQTHLDGLLGERININEVKRLLNVDEKGILEGFQNRPGKQVWIGEHVGKYLHAAVNTYRYSHDEKLKTQMDRIVAELIKTQLADGYLGTYKDDGRWVQWDVWVHKYDLIGLLSYYDLTGDEKSLDACKKIGDLLWRTFGDGEAGSNKGKDISKAGEHIGMAATSVLEPMCYLYRRTGDKKYLDFCLYITRSIEANSKVISNLTQTKRVYGTANNKAYEMLSNLVGLVELYRITGDETYLVPAKNAWEDVVANRLYVTGTGSTHEHWQEDGNLPAGDGDDIGEGCVTVTWMQLNLSLLRLTGEAKYASQLERSIYNHLLGAENTETGDICYYMALVGNKHPTPGINCCVSSVPRGISLIPQAMWGTRKDGIAINIYNSGTAKITLASGEVVEVTCNTKLPSTRDPWVELKFKSSKQLNFPVYLRWPKWAGEAKEKVDADGYIVVPNVTDGFVKMMRVEPNVTIIDGGQSYPKAIGLERGPQVFCFDAAKAKDVPLPAFAAFADAQPKLEAAGDAFQVAGVITTIDPATNTFKTEKKVLPMVSFADATSPRVWLPPADSLPTGTAPVTFGGTESKSRGGTGNPQEGPFTDLRTDTFRSTRNSGMADEDWFAVELPKPAKIARVVYRHGNARTNGGWFDTSAKGKPRIEYQEAKDGPWKLAGTLDDYPATTSKDQPIMANGQAFELKLKEPVTAFAIRVVGAPSGGYKQNIRFSTCAELQAYEN